MKMGLIALGCFCLLAACQPQPEEQPAGLPLPYAETSPSPENQKIVSRQDIEARLPFLSEKDRQFIQTSIGRQNLLQLIAREKLILLAAQDQALARSPQYAAQLEQKRLELDRIYQDYAAQALQNLWYEKQYENGTLRVTDEEINEYYKKYPYEMTIKQIIVDNAETADQLLRALKSNRSRWKELSNQYNTAPQAMRGEIAFMPGEFLPDIEVIAANSAVGSVQGFFKTAYGFHIIMKTGEKKLSPAEAQPRIRAVLENNKLDNLLETLQKKYEVVIYDQNE